MDFASACGLPPAETGLRFLSDGEDAVAIFVRTARRIRQFHTMFADTCRRRRAIETGRAVVDFMLDDGGADVPWGTTPLANGAARRVNCQIGARVIGCDEDEEVFEITRGQPRIGMA